MTENNRNQGNQSGSMQDQNRGQQGSSQQEDVNQNNPQQGSQWSNYQTRELAPKENTGNSKEDVSVFEESGNNEDQNK